MSNPHHHDSGRRLRATFIYLARVMAFAVSAMGFVLLAVSLEGYEVPMFDLYVLELVHFYAQPFIDICMVALTWLGSGVVLAPLEIAFLGWLLARKRFALAIFLTAAAGGAAILNSAIKNLVMRQRPQMWDTLVHESTYSFPSGHAMHTMALMLGLAIVLRHAQKFPQKALLLLVLLVGFSRVYLGVHYPSDVLGGWLAAVAWVLLCSLPFRWEKLAL